MLMYSHSPINWEDEKDLENRYLQIRQWRNEHIHEVWDDPAALNQFHDTLIKTTVQTAIEKVKSEHGSPPARFAFFLMGSGGRSEQSIWSDQDHGIIFAGSDEMKPYFLHLGEEISNGLHIVGYEFCDGKVMSSNPKWCNSITTWEQQIQDWLEEASWESLRYFSTFYDSRVLLGDESFLIHLKLMALTILQKNSFLYVRLLENISHVKKGIGVLGQLLPESSGKESGTINLKEVVFFPYVNSIRLLALKSGILAPSTLVRFQLLPKYFNHIKNYQSSFEKLLYFRLCYTKFSESYSDVHLLKIAHLSKKDKQELKRIMRDGYKLFSEVKHLIRKGCYDDHASNVSLY